MNHETKVKHFNFYGIWFIVAVAALPLMWSIEMIALFTAIPILYYIFEVSSITNDTLVKIAQAFVYAGALATLIFAFDLSLFLWALLGGWLLFGIGVSVCLHKLSSHRTFTPKNNLYKAIIIWFGTMCTLGSTIGWAAGHRQHHRYTDKEGDPHRPAGSLWHKIKVYFYYFPTYPISPMIVKDLTVDKYHKWFHKHYYKIIYSYVIALYLIDPIYAGYFYALPVLYVFTGISWVTVIAHIPSSKELAEKTGYRKDIYRIWNSDDYTYNSHVWQFLLMGEGYHNTHHACPGLWNNAILPGEFDISAQIIKVIGNPKSRNQRKFDSVRRYPEVFDEIAEVAERNAISDKPKEIRED